MITDPAQIAAVTAVDIECEAPDIELLFTDTGSTLIYEMATRNMPFRCFHVTVGKHSLSATAWGEPFDRARHPPAVEPKGATYTALSVARRNDGSWVAQCVIDV